MSSFNPNLAYFLQRLSGVSTNYFKLEPQNSTTAVAGNIIRFTLPNNCLLNLNSIALMLNAKITADAGNGRLPNRISSLVERYSIEAGGVQIAQGFNGYNVFCHLKDNLTCEHLDATSGHTEVCRTKSYVTGSAISTTETYSSGGGATQFCINHWEGMLGSMSPSIIDTALMPELVLTLYLAPNEVCIDAAGADMAGTSSTGIDLAATSAAPVYSINNFHLLVETIGIQDSVYDELLEKKIQSSGFVELPFKQYFSFNDTASTNNRWSVSSQSIDRVWVGYRTTGYNTAGGAVSVAGYKQSGAFCDNNSGETTADIDLGIPQYDEGGVYDTNKEKLISKYFNFAQGASGGTPTYQLQVNGSLIPQFRANAEQMLAITKNSLPMSKMTKFENMTLDQYKSNYFGWCVRFNLPDSEAGREVSGLDSRGINLAGQLLSENISSTQNVMMFIECSSTLRIGAAKQVEVLV